MPIKKSAIKRAKQSIARRNKNRILKTTFREAVKEVSRDIKDNKASELATDISKAIQAIDKAAKNNAIHKNAAARKKSKLMKRANAATDKPVKLKSIKKKQENNPAKGTGKKKSAPKEKEAPKKEKKTS